MKKLQKIIVNDYITYKKRTELKLRPDTVTVIRGNNQDRSDKNLSNGAGKSLIASILPSMRFNSTPMPMKVKKTPKDGFNKDTYQIICLEDELGNHFDIKKYFKGTTRLQITKNGKDLKIKDSSLKERSEASVHLASIIPTNEEQFYTMHYFDIKRPSAFQYGTDAQRHQFIEKLFNLDIYDRIGAEIKKDWDASKLIVQEIEILDEQLSDKSSNLKDDPEKLRVEHKKILDKTETLRQKVDSLIKVKDQCKTFVLLSNDVKEKSLDKAKDKAKKYKTELKSLRQDYTNAIANNETIKSNKEIADTKLRLQEDLSRYEDITIDRSIQKKIVDDRQLLDSVEAQKLKNKNTYKKIDNLENQLQDVGSSLKDTAAGVIKKADKFSYKKIEKARIRENVVLKDLETNLQDTLDHLKSHGEQNCPVCSTILNEDTLKSIIKDKRKKIEASKSRLTILSDMLEYKKLKDHEEELKLERQELKNLVKTIEHSASDLEERIKDNEELLGKMRKKVMIKAKLAELPVVEDREFIEVKPIKSKIGELENKISYYTDQYNKLEQIAKLDLPFSSLSEAKEKEESVNSALYQYQPLLDTLQSRLSTLSVNAVQAEALSNDIKELSSKVEELKLSAPNFKIQSVLRKAFGPRGIRKQRVAEIGLALESTLNKYAEQVFDFPISFELVITDTRFQILAYRNKSVGDVRNLSGAEARYFSLLLMMTLLRHTPNNILLDTVFLDEAEASLDKGFRDRLVSVFIPLLQEVVSKVVVITPMSESEMFIPKAVQYKVIKKDGCSTLTKL